MKSQFVFIAVGCPFYGDEVSHFSPYLNITIWPMQARENTPPPPTKTIGGCVMQSIHRFPKLLLCLSVLCLCLPTVRAAGQSAFNVWASGYDFYGQVADPTPANRS